MAAYTSDRASVQTARQGNAPNRVALTLFEKPDKDGPLSKKIALGADGKPVSDGSSCRMWRGKGRTVEIDLPDLPQFMAGLTTQQALSTGCITIETKRPNFSVTTKRRLERLKASGASVTGMIARTQEFVAFRPGEPALLLIDYDMKGMPVEVRDRIAAAGGFVAVLNQIAPDLAFAERIVRNSTSAGLSANGVDFPASGGVHLYVTITDGTDSERTLKTLHDRACATGYGWHIVGARGHILERSIVDRSVGTPERLIFEGAPLLEPPLTQDPAKRRPVYHEGAVVDSRVTVPDLSAAENAERLRLIAASRQTVQPEADLVREQWIKPQVERMIAELGTDPATAREWAGQQYVAIHGWVTLTGVAPLEFDDPDIGVVDVAAVLRDPDAFVGETLADPGEGVEYGTGKAKVMRDKSSGRPFIHSFAHGGINYRLAYDERLLAALLAKIDRTQALGVFANALPHSHLTPDAKTRLTAQVKKATGAKAADVKEAIKGVEDRHKAEARAAAEAQRPFFDMRPAVIFGTNNAPLLEVAVVIDDILGQVDVPEPAMRNLSGRIVEIVKVPPSGVHALMSDAEAATGERMAPPSIASIRPVSNDVGVGMVVEKFIRPQRVTKTGLVIDSSLPARFCGALNELAETKLPTITGIAELPLALPGRRLLAWQGLHRDLQTVFRIDPALLGVLPDPGDCTVEAAAAAYRFLADDWLGDVAADADGKAALIAAAASIVERHLLAERPAFFLTAPQAESGKTTVVNMIAAATLGTGRAPAKPWSIELEERRKSLFAALRSGLPMICWDNIAHGSQLSCPVIEASLTDDKIRDRVLGHSREEVVPTTSIQLFTGNAIGPKGDLSTRSLVVTIDAAMANPANRAFRHPNPIGWSLENRLEVLRALFVVLLVERPELATIPTRFKDWYRLVGHPIEVVSGVSFDQMFKRTLADDEETDALRTILSAWWDDLGDAVAVTASDVSHWINGDSCNHYITEESEVLRNAFFAAGGGKGFQPNLLVTGPAIGYKLKSIAGHTVRVDGVEMRIDHVGEDRGSNEYRLTIRSGQDYQPPNRKPRQCRSERLAALFKRAAAASAAANAGN